ncbi:hypothetical protein QA635_23880 [Bradyrhizobium brasilense]|uniref:hypothetical protein n=1 Tax=Bradyrhizobium brasilense TaxID=1419277 RepID=UPI0024B21D2D|nr:hypothetical protein [Bradyrhizobium australafricanum]WFU29643.1 hypothetical protein QA635_23880 [Bradyrhizobium australafricanum]
MNSMELALQPLRRRLARLVARCVTLIDGVINPYRPELYYMRGPGPKCRARRQATLRD